MSYIGRFREGGIMLNKAIIDAAQHRILRRILWRLDIELLDWQQLSATQQQEAVLNEMMQSAYVIVEHINKSYKLYDLRYDLTKSYTEQELKQQLVAIFSNVPSYGFVSGNSEFELIAKVIRDDFREFRLNLKDQNHVSLYIDSMDEEDLLINGSMAKGVEYYYTAFQDLNTSRVFQHLVHILSAPGLLDTIDAHKNAIAQQQVICRFIIDYIERMTHKHKIHPEFSYLRTKLIQQVELMEIELRQLSQDKQKSCFRGALCFNFMHHCPTEQSMIADHNLRHNLLRYCVTDLR